MGITSQWEPKGEYPLLYARRGNVNVFFSPDINLVLNVNDASIRQNYGSDVPPPLLVNDRFYLPIKYITDVFGAKREWNNETRTVIITE